jgi:hypothetical protein
MNLKTVITTGWTSYLLVAIALLAALGLTVVLARWSVEAKAKDLTRAFELSPPQNNEACEVVTNPEHLAFINRQKGDIVKYANAHRNTAVEFYGYFYSTFAVFSLFGFIALISGVVIAKGGYDKADPHLVTVLLVSTGIVLLYQGFFGVFQQKANVDNNAKLFAAYSKLLTKVDTYCATGKIPVVDPSTVFGIAVALPKATPSPVPTATPDPALKPPAEVTAGKPSNQGAAASSAKPSTFYVPLDPEEFINYVGWQVEQLKSISIAFDDSKIIAINKDKLMVLPD